MSFWGATVITNVRGRKVVNASRFQVGNVFPDEGKREMSSLQTAKKVRWKPRQGGFNNTWNYIFRRNAGASYCMFTTYHLFDPNSVRRQKTIKHLRDTIASIYGTYVTAKWWTICPAKIESTHYKVAKAERGSNENLRKPLNGLLKTVQKRLYWERKGNRMFTTQNSNELTWDEKSLQNNNNTKNDKDTNKVNLCGPNDSIYKTAIQISNLEAAFKRLKGSAAPGIDGHTKAAYGRPLGKSIEKLYRDLKNQKYKPSPIKVVHIPKPKGGKRPLGISSVRDKIVQASFHKELSDIYEPKFYDCSFGFRPKKSCHSALKQIKKKWQSVKWFINLDIDKMFDKVQHDILIKNLQKEVKEQEIIELIRKLLKVGYVDIHNLTNRERYNQEGTPQGSIISPLLANIYLHELDKFIQEKLIPEYTEGEKRKADKAKQYRINNLSKEEKANELVKEYPALMKIIPKLKHNKAVEDNKASYYQEGDYYKRLHYVRYVDDILLGLVGSKNDAKDILRKINSFLQEELKLNLNLDKSSINLGYETQTEFLGFLIGRYRNKTDYKKIVIEETEITVVTNTAINAPSLLIPTKKILERLTTRGFIRKLEKSNRYKGKGVGFLTVTSDQKIVERFSSMIRGYCNYYICANRRSKLWCVVHALKESCYLTLAWKHKLKNKKKTIEKYGPNLRIHVDGRQVTELYYPKSLKTMLKYFERSEDGYIGNLMELDSGTLKSGIEKRENKKGNICAYVGPRKI